MLTQYCRTMQTFAEEGAHELLRRYFLLSIIHILFIYIRSTQ
jgi:hypothetical protein